MTTTDRTATPLPAVPAATLARRVAALLDHCPPADVPRLARAADIAQAGGIEHTTTGDYLVPGSRPATAYVVSANGGCTCPDAASGRPGPLGCKHALAVRLTTGHTNT